MINNQKKANKSILSVNNRIHLTVMLLMFLAECKSLYPLRFCVRKEIENLSASDKISHPY